MTMLTHVTRTRHEAEHSRVRDSMVPLRPASAGMSTKPTVVPGRGREARLISAIRDAATRLATFRPTANCSRRRPRCETVVAQEGPDTASVQIEAFALMREAIRRVRGVELYDVQLLAALILAQGRVAEMQTGEGKTLACAPAAYLHGSDRSRRPHRHSQRLPGAPRLRVALARLPDAWESVSGCCRNGRGRSQACCLSVRRHVRHGLRIRLRLPARPVVVAANGRSPAGADAVGRSPRW